jgi:hypothetical protein
MVPGGLALLPMAGAAQTLAPGTALVSVTGDVETTLVLPLVPGTGTPTEDGYELRFQDATLDTLNVTLTVDAGLLADVFVGVGVPGTSIFDDAYFADFLHTQCVTDVVTLDATGVALAIDCAGLENGAGDTSVDLHVELTTVGLPDPSGSPVVGSPTPSGPASSPASSPAA